MRSIIVLLGAAWLVTVPAIVRAELCAKCRGRMYVTAMGTCPVCEGPTASTAYRLCRSCSAKLGLCQVCKAPLNAAPEQARPTGSTPGSSPRPTARRPARPDRIEPFAEALALTGSLKQQYLQWLAGHNPPPDFQAIADHLHPQLDPARAALLSALLQLGGKPTLTQIFSGPVFLDASADRQTITLETEQLLVVSLPANRATGFRWILEPLAGNVLQQLGQEQYVQVPCNQAPATYACALGALEPGTATVQWRCARPRDPQHPNRLFRLTVQVKKPLPLLARLDNHRATYPLPPSLQNKTAAQLSRGRQPLPPAVDMVLHIVNRYDKPITLMSGSDREMLLMDLEGPGAVTVPANIAMTEEMRLGKPLTLKPGQWYSLPIKQMSFGLRGAGKLAYWTRPGSYRLTVRYQGITAPPASQTFTLQAPPVRFNVTQAAR